jgi:formylglycine-generating enzyme required for sulfatase activity
MTELEYEKACRGILPPIYGEYAWGTNSVVGDNQINAYSLSYEGTESEGIFTNYSNTIGNANHYFTNNAQDQYNTFIGPFRVGIFSANGANTGRITSGSSFWGIMELSGNMYEQCVSLNKLNGRNFRGSNGDGSLLQSGGQNVEYWPSDYDLLTKGGSWRNGPQRMSVSNREEDYYDDYSLGFRGVRSPAQ